MPFGLNVHFNPVCMGPLVTIVLREKDLVQEVVGQGRKARLFS
jgi:hypothetical protein